MHQHLSLFNSSAAFNLLHNAERYSNLNVEYFNLFSIRLQHWLYFLREPKLTLKGSVNPFFFFLNISSDETFKLITVMYIKVYISGIEMSPFLE